MNKDEKVNPECSSVAVFGLGSMGAGMAASLLRVGHRVFGFDPDPGRQGEFIKSGGQAGEPHAIGAELDAVVTVVLNQAQTEAVLFGEDGIVPGLKSGSCVISCATVPPAFAMDMESRCREHGVHYLDAPISGGSVKAGLGQLSVMASGSSDAVRSARFVLDAVAETVFELGDRAGPGSAMKAVNQLLAGVHISAMAEAMTFGIKQGIEPDQLVKVISQCAGSSWMFENRAPHVVEGDYTPHSSIAIWPKDLGIVREIAGQSGCPVPLVEAALAQFQTAVEAGLASEDDAAVTKVYANRAGIDLPDA